MPICISSNKDNVCQYLWGSTMVHILGLILFNIISINDLDVNIDDECNDFIVLKRLIIVLA